MGYYSIYKIVKDIINTIFGRKFFRYTLIVLIVFTIFFIIGEKGVFASFTVTSDNGVTFTLPDNNYQHVAIFSYNGYWSGSYRGVVFFNDTIYFNKVSTNPSDYAFRISSNNNSWGYILDKSSTTTDFSSFQITQNNNFFQIDLKNLDFIYSNGTVYKDNEIVFEPEPSFVSPQFYNKQNFIDFSDDSLVIYPNDYPITDTLYLHMLTVDSTVTDDNNTYYYYGQRIFALNNNSEYYNITDDTVFYNIPRYVFSLHADYKYIFFLSDNDERINNSVGLYDYSSDYDGFVLEPTANQIGLGTILDNQQNINDKLDSIDNFLNNDTVDDNTSNEIDNSLNTDTSTNGDMIVTSFFTRLTSIITDLGDYNLQEDTEIVLPVPFTNGNIVLHSNYLYTYLSSAFKVIIEGFWYYLFGFYIFKFVNKIYISIKSGKILDGVSSSDEVITNDML